MEIPDGLVDRLRNAIDSLANECGNPPGRCSSVEFAHSGIALGIMLACELPELAPLIRSLLADDFAAGAGESKANWLREERLWTNGFLEDAGLPPLPVPDREPDDPFQFVSP